MMKLFLLCILAFVAFGLPNQRPIIGIYTQVNEDDPPRADSDDIFQTFISASYVKFIQMSGAQVVPIFAYDNQSEIAALLPKLNGVLFPGGDLDFDIKNRWTSNANFIFQWAIQENDKGRIFPIWGTCMGHQLLGYLTCNGVTPLSPVRGEQSIINSIKFITGDKGYIFDQLPERLITKLTTGQGVTYYNHEEAILMSTYSTNKKLSDFWKVTAQTTSSYNQKFVAVWQARKYPFYSVQFHPEKSVFEWKVFSDKSYDSVQISQWMSNKFIEKARQSANQYSSEEEFEKTNIYNYKTYSSVMRFTRIYLFNETKPVEGMREKKNFVEEKNLESLESDE